jgi:hypothetical protein
VADHDKAANKALARNSRRAGQLTGLGNLNIIVAVHVQFRRLCVSLKVRQKRAFVSEPYGNPAESVACRALVRTVRQRTAVFAYTDSSGLA